MSEVSEVKKWQARGAEGKAVSYSRKQVISTGFGPDVGLQVYQPQPEGSGKWNDGNPHISSTSSYNSYRRRRYYALYSGTTYHTDWTHCQPECILQMQTRQY
jgi:hypothetical protein